MDAAQVSQFDPALFLDATIDQPSVKRPPLPAAMDFVGVIGEIKPRTWVGKKDPTQGGVVMDVQITIDLSAYPEVQKLIGLPKVVMFDGIMLDLTANGAIDNAPGKNRRLRLYREALDMNKPGDVFSFRMMQGRMVRVKIAHEVYQGDVMDKIDSVAKA